MVNEIAPRPHNSGHYTIEACHTSQFENHLRAILNLPLGSTGLRVQASGMINLLGRSNGEEGMADLFRSVGAALPLAGASVHLYGKRECRKGRKMGHITVCADSMLEVYAALESLDAAGSGSPHPVATPHAHTVSLSPMVGIIMGSDSDLPTLKPACSILSDFGVPFEVTIVSAHRTPARMMDYAKSAHVRGLKVIIAAAGGAAHLPGMVAAMTPLPVIGVPVALKVLDGVDSLHSIVQMPVSFLFFSLDGSFIFPVLRLVVLAKTARCPRRDGRHQQLDQRRPPRHPYVGRLCAPILAQAPGLHQANGSRRNGESGGAARKGVGGVRGFWINWSQLGHFFGLSRKTGVCFSFF